MLDLGRAHSFAAGERLPDWLPLAIDRSLSCPTRDEFDDYARTLPPSVTRAIEGCKLASLNCTTTWIRWTDSGGVLDSNGMKGIRGRAGRGIASRTANASKYSSVDPCLQFRIFATSRPKIDS